MQYIITGQPSYFKVDEHPDHERGPASGGVRHPLSLKFQGQLSLIPKIIETVIPKITYLSNLTIGGNFKALSDL